MEQKSQIETPKDYFGETAIYHRWKHPQGLIIPQVTNTRRIGNEIKSGVEPDKEVLIVADSVRVSEVLSFVNGNTNKPDAVDELNLVTSQLRNQTYLVAGDYLPHVMEHEVSKGQKLINAEVAVTTPGIGFALTAFLALLKDEEKYTKREFLARFARFSAFVYSINTVGWNLYLDNSDNSEKSFETESIPQDFLTRNLVLQVKLEDYQGLLRTEKQNTHMILGKGHFAENLQELTRKELHNTGSHVESSLLIEREFLRWRQVDPEEERLLLTKMITDATTSILLKADGGNYYAQNIPRTNSEIMFHPRCAPEKLLEMIDESGGNIEAGIDDYIKYINQY